VGLDLGKRSSSVAVADSGRVGEAVGMGRINQFNG
jgi:hypothetical protein